MQLEVASMLLAHAKSGRKLLVETHSDLFIRRVMRAVLEEELPQEAMGIYFVNVDSKYKAMVQNERTPFFYSNVEPLRVNNRGQIENWPDGFLDDDVAESQRLLDIMYGGRGEEEDDE